LWSNPEDQIAAAELDTINKELNKKNEAMLPIDEIKGVAVDYDSAISNKDKEDKPIFMALKLIFENIPVKAFMPPEFGPVIQDADCKQLNPTVRRPVTESQQQDTPLIPQKHLGTESTDVNMEIEHGSNQTDPVAATEVTLSCQPGYTGQGEQILCYFPSGRGYRFAIKTKNGPPELRSGAMIGRIAEDAYRKSNMVASPVRTRDVSRKVGFREMLWIASTPIQTRKVGGNVRRPTTVCSFKMQMGTKR
jgi:hypothetical protein